MWKTEYKIKYLLVFNHLMMLIGLIYASPWWLLLTMVGWVLINRVGGEIGLHRYFCHRSFRTGRFREYLLLYLAILNCVGSPLVWSMVHRKHHSTSDTHNDPHGDQPAWRVWSTFWEPYVLEPSIARDMVRNKTYMWFHEHYFTIVLTTMLVLGAYHWQIPVFLICGSSLITFHTAGLVNTVCHTFGYRNYDTLDKSTNSTWVNWLTMGSGLHNNHHRYPSSHTNKTTWFEIDPPGWIIEVMFMKDTVHAN